ncbi:MAG: MBL fold metallo-hydrolase [Solirubrobacterales bacterium]
MRVINLTEKSNVYTCNAYLVQGTWNALSDVNTLVDVGRDEALLERIKDIRTGVGKRRVDQVILTHSHYDHTGLLPRIRMEYKPRVLAYSSSLEGVDELLYDGQMIKLGERLFEVMHAPGHSSDSICLYCAEEKVLFAGDTSIRVQSVEVGETYEYGFATFLQRLALKDVQIVYFGHGEPMTKYCNEVIRESAQRVFSVLHPGMNK